MLEIKITDCLKQEEKYILSWAIRFNETFNYI